MNEVDFTAFQFMLSLFFLLMNAHSYNYRPTTMGVYWLGWWSALSLTYLCYLIAAFVKL